MRKLKVLFQSDFALAKTGFGRHMKALLSYLYKTGKYEILHYSCGLNYSSPVCQKTPWKSFGCLPDNPQEMDNINKDPVGSRIAAYGAYMLDKVIQSEKPDVYIAIQDYWGVDFAIPRYWFNKIPCVLWMTLDSLPLLPGAVENAPKVQNYWVWSSFAEKEMHRLGHKHVKTVHGALESKHFYKLPNIKRKELRTINNIPQDAFVVGFVFRNQLRKSVPNLLEGYADFRKRIGGSKKAFLLLHTSFEEGWNILRLADEYKVDHKEILTTYVCRQCGRYEIKPFEGKEVNCRFCKTEKACVTTNVTKGVSEEQLNEIYNLMNVYCHPFTSGGQEIPVQEAKLTELITLVTSYSCGEELCEEGSGSLALDWSEYREHGTEFRKASTLPASICKRLLKVYNLDPKRVAEIGALSRRWVLENFSVESVAKKVQEFLDSCQPTTYDFINKQDVKRPDAIIPQDLNDSDFIIALYKEILNCEVDTNNDGYKYWMDQIKQKIPRGSIEAYFRKVAVDDNSKINQMDFGDFLGKEDEGKRMVFVLPESIGDVYLASSLFKSLKETYPDYNLYVATKPEHFEVVEGNPYVHRVIPYAPQMESIFWLEGIGKHKGFFNIAFLPFIGTQRIIDYTHNGIDKLAFNIDS